MFKSSVFATCLLALFIASGVSAQQPGSSAPVQEKSVTAGRARPNAAYLGISYSIKPAMAPDGSMRLAEHPAITAVAPGSPAAKVGIAVGDVILSANGVDALDPKALFGEAGKVYVLRIRRGSEVREFTVQSTASPGAEATSAPAHP